MERYFDVVKRLKNEDVKLPERSTEDSAGYDFFAIEDVEIKPSLVISIPPTALFFGTFNPQIHLEKPVLIRTGIKAKMPKGEGLFLYNRSSNPNNRNLILANGVGVVDNDYFENEKNDGEIAFAFYNMGAEPIVIHKGDKIGQGVFEEYKTVDNDKAQGIRKGGFGSTGE